MKVRQSFHGAALTRAKAAIYALVVRLGTAAVVSASWLLVTATLLHSSVSHAQSSADRPSDEPVPSCLDQTIVGELGEELRPRGVQKRVFLKQGHFQLTARGGLFAGDLLSSSYVAGGALAFYATEDLAVEVSFDVTPMELDLDKPLTTFFGDDRFESGLGYLALAGLLWTPIHAKAKVGDSIIHADIAFAAGAGRLLHDSTQGIAFDTGMVLELFTTQWVTLRFDIRDVILLQEAVAETRLTNNIIASFGLAFWIPTPL